jgi:hypothetical protein
MGDQKKAKLFAFNLAVKQEEKAKPEAQWKVREGVAVAGCTGPVNFENYRESISVFGAYMGRDKGYYC